MTYSYLIFDLVIAALLLFAIWQGYQKGFILTLCGFLAIFVALIGATVVSGVLAEPVARTIRPLVEQQIQQLVKEQTDAVLVEEGDGEQIGLSLHETLELLKDSKLYKGFAEMVQKAVDNGIVSATTNAGRVIADYISKQLARIVLFAISFVLILILWFFISHALDLAFRLPVLSTLNHWSGAALGLVRGGLLVFVACWLLKGSFLPQEAIDHSVLLRLFCTVNPLSLFS